MERDMASEALRPMSGAPSVGLVLGGGGARGLAHILMLEVFDDLELRPKVMAGTSIGAIFAAVYQGVALLKSGEHKQFGLKRKDKRDLATDQALFSKVFNYVTQVLNIQQPEVYFRQDQPGAMQLANTKEKGLLIPSLVVGAEMLQGRSDKELAFPIARYLTGGAVDGGIAAGRVGHIHSR